MRRKARVVAVVLLPCEAHSFSLLIASLHMVALQASSGWGMRSMALLGELRRILSL